ncbi:MAG: hypothetical protein NZ704_09405 [Geminicoccaceae bacterium]|nr:hypothetical protein [Geminicoccaceae bacterium]
MEPRLPTSAAPVAPGAPGEPLFAGTRADGLVDVLRRNLGTIVGVVLALDLAAAGWLWLRPLAWTASAELLIEAEDRDFADLRREIDLRTDRPQPADLESEVRILASPRLARAVIEAEGLAAITGPDAFAPRLADLLAGASEWLLDWVAGVRSSFAGFPTDLSARLPDEPEVPIPDEEELVQAFGRALAVRRDPLARVITVSFTANDPERAARVVDRLVQLYLEDRIAAQREALLETARYLEERAGVLARELEEAERRVKEFQGRKGLFSVEGVSALERRWAELGRELTLARIQLAEARARLDRLESARREGGLSGLKEVAGSPVIGELRRQEAEVARRIADLSGQYGPRHPLMQNARAELADIRRSIAAEIERIATVLRNEVAVAEEKVARLEAETAETERRLAEIGASQVELAELQRRAEGARALYEAVLDRYRRAREQQNLLRPAARLITPPSPPSRPSNAPRALVLGFTTLAGAGLGCSLAFLRELRRRGILNSAEAEAELGLPVLGVLPRVAGFERSPRGRRRVRSENPAGLAAWQDAVHRTLVRLESETSARAEARGRIVGITSAVPREGKTTLALALARQAALGGRRTLLVDADLRRRALAPLLGLGEDQPGLVELLSGTCRAIDQLLVVEPESRLRILPAGGTAEAPQTLLAAPRAQIFFAGLRELCDLVILDLPPVLAVSDALAMAPVLDGALLVLRWNDTPREAARAAAREMAQLGVRVAGVALNAVDLDFYGRYGSADPLRYAGSYARYYGVPGRS